MYRQRKGRPSQHGESQTKKLTDKKNEKEEWVKRRKEKMQNKEQESEKENVKTQKAYAFSISSISFSLARVGFGANCALLNNLVW